MKNPSNPDNKRKWAVYLWKFLDSDEVLVSEEDTTIIELS
jgi:hypothetical protein